MKAFNNCAIAFLIGCFTPLLIWVGNGIALFHRYRRVKAFQKALTDLICSIDSDCPPGYICLSGRCVPVKR